MRQETQVDGTPENGSPSIRRLPWWLRALLLGLLVAAASGAFYVNNLRIIERLSE